MQHDAHTFSCHSGHGVIVVPEQRNTHHWNAVIHGLIDAVQATMTQKGPGVGMTLRKKWVKDVTLQVFECFVYSFFKTCAENLYSLDSHVIIISVLNKT